jgi:hypothetical protein
MILTGDVIYIKCIVMETRRKVTKWRYYCSLWKKLHHGEEVTNENIWGMTQVLNVLSRGQKGTQYLYIITIRK